MLTEDGQPIAPFTRAECMPVRADKTKVAVQWKGAGDLTAVAGKPVRFRFSLKDARLYAFWVSATTSGVSHGYVGAGGPGFAGAVDG